MNKAIISLLVFLSGFAGLVYQVLWMRKLGLLFGNTAHAAGATLALFFAGLAVGSWYWGRRLSTRSQPLRVYAWLEVGIAGTALLYFAVISIFYLIYPMFYQMIGPGVILFCIKCILAAILVFPPAFCMGGTIPAIGEYLIDRKETFGKTTAWIYGINTLGAALGALTSVFYLVSMLGFNLTCVLAMIITSCIAICAFLLARKKKEKEVSSVAETAKTEDVISEPPSTPAAPAKKGKKKKKRKRKDKEGQVETPEDQPVFTGVNRRTILFIAFISGFSVLALEVLWTRMFAQIHENSVYSFAMVVVIVLVCLSLGAIIASFMARLTGITARLCLSLLLLGSGLVLAFSPSLFIKLTGNFSMLTTSNSFVQYFTILFILAFSGIAPPCLLLGTIFPFLMKNEEAYADHPGKSIGELSAVNTVGAILGSLLCGFVLLRFIGMWWTMQSIAILYLVIGIILPAKRNIAVAFLRLSGIAAIVLIFTWLNPAKLNVVGGDPGRGSMKILDIWETSDCTVSVVEASNGVQRIMINSNYILGSTGALKEQEFQAYIPLLLYPETKSVFFLGMGTGITVGGSLDKELFPSLKRVVACELVPEVVEASKLYMAGGKGGKDYTHGLFDDDRVEIVVDDGRHYLMATDEKFDMINADLFLPYRNGAGSLYSQENFESIKERLTPDGVYVQWLPLFQMTEFEFGVITNTMLSVFDNVTMWRNNFIAGREIVALIAHNSKKPVTVNNEDDSKYKKAVIENRDWRHIEILPLSITDRTVPILYCGNISDSKALFENYPINTDDKPMIEYMAPRSLRKKSTDGFPINFVGPRLADMVDKLLKKTPPDKDPLLSGLSAPAYRLPYAGSAFHRVWIGYRLQDVDRCSNAWNDFVRNWISETQEEE